MSMLLEVLQSNIGEVEAVTEEALEDLSKEEENGEYSTGSIS